MAQLDVEPKKKSNWWIWLLIILAVLLAWWIFMPADDNQMNETANPVVPMTDTTMMDDTNFMDQDTFTVDTSAL